MRINELESEQKDWALSMLCRSGVLSPCRHHEGVYVDEGIDIESAYKYSMKVYRFAPIFPDTCYHLTHYKPAAVDIPVASDNPVHYADAIRYNARTPLQGSLLPLTRLVWA